MVGPRCIISGPTKMFFPQNKEKTKRRKVCCLMDENAHMHLHMGFIRTLLFFTFFTNFFSLPYGCCLQYFFFFFLDLLGRQPVYMLILFFFFFIEMWIFFFEHDFLNKFWCLLFFSFGCLSLFLVLIGYLFLTRVYE